MILWTFAVPILRLSNQHQLQVSADFEFPSYQLPVGSQVRGAREGTLGYRLANTATRDC